MAPQIPHIDSSPVWLSGVDGDDDGEPFVPEDYSENNGKPSPLFVD